MLFRKSWRPKACPSLALRAGRHVLSEVTAAVSLRECWELLDAVRASGATYMLAENYCYMRSNVLVREMVRKGLFGEIYFGEGEYLHDVRALHHFADGSPRLHGPSAADLHPGDRLGRAGQTTRYLTGRDGTRLGNAARRRNQRGHEAQRSARARRERGRTIQHQTPACRTGRVGADRAAAHVARTDRQLHAVAAPERGATGRDVRLKPVR